MNFQASEIVKTEEAKPFPYCGVQNISYGIDGLNVSPDNPVPQLLEEGRKIAARDVTVFVDGCRKNSSFVSLIPGRVISSAAKEGDSEWSAGHDHLASLMRVASRPR